MGFGYVYYDWSFFILIPAIIFTFYAQLKVKGNFSRYSKIRVSSGVSGQEAARQMLSASGINYVSVMPVSGSLTDHFDPRNNSISLSETVYDNNSVAAVAVACHEVGHAIQHETGYGPLKFRDTLVPVVNLTSMASWPMAIIGIMLLGSGSYQIGNMLFNLGIIFFGVVVLFHLVTLPVELNASSRALAMMTELGIVSEAERSGAKKVLSAAAMTYIAALATALANMIRLIAMRNSRN